MALKSTSAPLDQYVRSEWREQLCTLAGIAFASQSSEWQTIIDNIINEAFESCSQEASHHPWGQQETTLTVTAGTDGVYAMPAAFRHIVAIHEVSTDGSILSVNQTEKRVYFSPPEGHVGSHPWANSQHPYWFYDGLTSAEPPVQQWRRIGADNTGATVYVLFRPYFNLLAASGQDTYPYLPPAYGKVLREQMLEDWHAFSKDITLSAFHGARKREAQASLEKNDLETVEAPRRLGCDPDFARQMG